MRAVVWVLVAAVCFGTTGTAQALGPDVDATALGAARIALGGCALGLIALLGVRRRARPRPVRLDRSTTALVLVGGAGVLAYQPTFFAGTGANGVAVGTVVALGSAPVLTGVLGWVLTGQRPTPVWWVATVCALAGVAVLGLADGTDGALSVPGLLASVGAGAAYAVYTLAGKGLLERGWTSVSAMGATFGVAGLGGLALLAGADREGLGSGSGLLTVAWLGLVTVTVAYVFFGAGLAVLPAATVATLTLAEPVTATLLGVLVLDERLSARASLGVAILALGIVVLVAGSRAPRAARVPT